MVTGRREPVLLGLYDPHRRLDAGVTRSAFVRAARTFGSVTVHEHAPLTLAVAGPDRHPGTDGELLCVIEGSLDDASTDLPQLWRQSGADLVHGLRGGFALVVWDPGEQRGMVARDQLGQRPIFLY